MMQFRNQIQAVNEAERKKTEAKSANDKGVERATASLVCEADNTAEELAPALVVLLKVAILPVVEATVVAMSLYTILLTATGASLYDFALWYHGKVNASATLLGFQPSFLSLG